MSPPRIVFYGDDFTGSTDALEVLAFAGLRTAMFLQVPTPELLARFPGLEAIGVAGDSRGMSRAEIDRAMPAILAGLKAVGAGIVHYKVCSTFDSSPETGSIGRVIGQARRIFDNRATPILGGTPALGRYCLFGNLFARSGTDGEIYRIDRHPVMSVHPVTPMNEGDLARHIALQAELRIEKLGFPDLERGPDHARAALARIAERSPDAVLIDAGQETHMMAAAALITEEASRAAPLFVVGGSGVEYALTRLWREGAPAPALSRFESLAPVDRLPVLSGSASRVTAAQIDAAVAAGFVDLAADSASLLADGGEEAGRLIEAGIRALGEGRSILIHTVRGPDDPRIAAVRNAAAAKDAPDAGFRLGRAQGEILLAILERTGLRRAVVAGGDTSSQAVKMLGPEALEVAARLSPGVPLCRMHAAGRSYDGMEIALKGGQFGAADFFLSVRDGRRAAA